jgi:ubiquinone/menaquinone biosynthesis C-methylase UbiE
MLMPHLDDFAIKLLSKLAAPRLKALLWRRFYEELARNYGQGDWTFMNYGFWDEEIAKLPLSAGDAPNRPFIGLYERVTRGLDLRGKDVVEVGSGRGGGAAYLARAQGPKVMLGLDFSHQATQLAQSLHDVPGLRFEQGDALCLPLQAASFDIVLNVESSHCYASMPKFLGEVVRVLRPGGTFSWCDMRLRAEWDEVLAQFAAAGLEIESDIEITPEVVSALDLIAPVKGEAIMRRVPRWLQRSFAGFAGMPGSKVYSLLQSGEICYGAVQARKV